MINRENEKHKEQKEQGGKIYFTTLAFFVFAFTITNFSSSVDSDAHVIFLFAAFSALVPGILIKFEWRKWGVRARFLRRVAHATLHRAHRGARDVQGTADFSVAPAAGEEHADREAFLERDHLGRREERFEGSGEHRASARRVNHSRE